MNRERLIRKYERCFSKHKYNGAGKCYFRQISGPSEVVITAPLSVNNSINANRYTGGLARLLACETGCRTVYAAKTIMPKDMDLAKKQYCDMIDRERTKILVELRTNHSSNSGIVISADGKNKEFLKRLALYTIQYEYRDSEGESVSIEDASIKMETFMDFDRNVSKLTLNINEDMLLRPDISRFETFFLAIKRIIVSLNGMDWTTDKFNVYRLWQAHAKSQIPQDKVEFVKTKGNAFCEDAFVHICSFEGLQETARVNAVQEGTVTELENFLQDFDMGTKDEYIVLTNRLIEMIFEREWFEGEEELPGLRGAPVIVYENEQDQYEIGIPKANQVNNIALSTELYKEKKELSSKYDYLVFNRYSDSRIYIDIGKSDYKDNGRVKSKDGIPNAKKIMIPRYYRLMLGYLDKPLKTIRIEEYKKLLSSLPTHNEVEGEEAIRETKCEITQEDFIRCYQRIPGQAYMQLIEQENMEFESEKSEYSESRRRITKYLEKIGAYSHVDLIRVPKALKPKTRIINRIRNLRKRVWIKILKQMIGRAEYILKTSWAGDTDDKNSVARLNSNMMSLLGVSENDKIMIRFGDRTIVLRVLPKDDLTDYEIGIPSSARRILKMNSMNDIVIVHRDMEHTFKRHSQEQTIAILGTVLAVVQVLTVFDIFTKTWMGIMLAIVVCVTAIAVMLYLALSEERVKVK